MIHVSLKGWGGGTVTQERLKEVYLVFCETNCNFVCFLAGVPH